MHFLFIDTETVAIPQDINKPINDIDNWPAVRQIAWIICNENREIIDRHNYVTGSIHPVDNSVEGYCPQEVMPIHKIIPLLMQDLQSSVYLIGHNVDYDTKVIAAEMYRLGYDTRLIESLPQICTMHSSVDFCYFAGRTDSRYPKLQELYTKLFHEPFINAHDAYCDIYATYKCFWALVDKDIISKRDYEELYTQQELIDHYNALSTKVTKSDYANAKKDDAGVTYSSDGKRLLSTHGRYIDEPLLEGCYSIPEGVEVICDNAFWSSRKLQKLIIPKTVKKIGEYAFEFCNELTIICHSPYFASILKEPVGHDLYDKVNNRIISFFDYPGGVIYSTNARLMPEKFYDEVYVENTYKGSLDIGVGAFAGSRIETLIIGENVSVNRSAFYQCQQLISITLPETLTEFPDQFLNGCKNLQHINFPSRLKRIGVGALFNCCSLKKISLPESVSEVCDYAFRGCASLEEIEIPESVTQLNKDSFSNCPQLKGFVINTSVDKIESNPFAECFNLKIVGSKRFVFQDGALYDDVEKRLISYIGTANNYSVRNGTLSIGDRAFCNCKSLFTIKLPESITSIGEEAFYGCENLQSISIPTSIATIKKKTFYLCKSIKELSIPASVTVVEDDALYNCSSLVDLYLFNPHIKMLGNYPFLACDALKNIYVPEGMMNQFRNNRYLGSVFDQIREPGAIGAIKRWWKNR